MANETVCARDLKPGDTLKTAIGPALIEKIEEEYGGLAMWVRRHKVTTVLWLYPQQGVIRKAVKRKRAA